MTEKRYRPNKLSTGIPTRPLFIKHVEYEYWDMMKEIQNQQPDVVTIADTIRFALKRATGRI